ncbi:phospholipase A2 inhibitor subunit gamma B-like isoform X2 [Alligator sinensis]|nr:phospholipase A2 inhibitor subunit gamma B-like isoform X2 [Alligator sinensis]
MKAPVILYVLLAFLHQGSSLQCEVCEAIGDSCSGPMETCDPGEDTCGIIKSEMILGGVKVVTYAKSCLSSDVCPNIHFSMDFGKGIRNRNSIACCTGEACQTASVQLPPLNTTPNGLQCPACFSIGSSDCDTEIAYCTGSETYCFDFAGSFSMGEVTLNTAVKGCIALSECTRPEVLMKAGQGFSMDFTQFECKPASPAASKSSGWTLLTMPCFPIMAGFILIKTMA